MIWLASAGPRAARPHRDSPTAWDLEIEDSVTPCSSSRPLAHIKQKNSTHSNHLWLNNLVVFYVILIPPNIFSYTPELGARRGPCHEDLLLSSSLLRHRSTLLLALRLTISHSSRQPRILFTSLNPRMSEAKKDLVLYTQGTGNGFCPAIYLEELKVRTP